MGLAAATLLPQLRRLASVVPADRVTRISENAAQQKGLALRVFASQPEALDWLLSHGKP